MQVLAFILWRKILTIGTARSGLNPDSDVGVGGLILKLTKF